MKKKGSFQKKSKKRNLSWSASEKKVLITIGLIFFALIIAYYSLIVLGRSARENAYKAYIGKEIPDSMVCMVSGIVKQKAIKPIETGGKTYWGCCNKCLSKLSNNLGNIQFAKDPFSGTLINKAYAIIRLDPQNKRHVLFFESNRTYEQYIHIVNR